MIIDHRHPFFVRQIAIYWPFHRNVLNWLTHVIAIPATALGVMIPLDWLVLFHVGGYGVSLATVGIVLGMVFWLWVDFPFGLANSVLYGILLFLADRAAELPVAAGLTLAIVLFVGGWLVQLVGHIVEDRQLAAAGGPPFHFPSTLASTFATPNGTPVDQLIQLAVVPMVVTGEALLRIGFRPKLKKEVEAIAER